MRNSESANQTKCHNLSMCGDPTSKDAITQEFYHHFKKILLLETPPPLEIDPTQAGIKGSLLFLDCCVYDFPGTLLVLHFKRLRITLLLDMRTIITI